MRFDNQLMAPVALALLTALVVSFLMTPVVKSFAYKVGAIDVPKDERRMHHKPIPRLGGLAIFAGFMASILLFVDIRLNPQMQSILLGAVIIVVLGVVDDIMALPAKLKFAVDRGDHQRREPHRRTGRPCQRRVRHFCRHSAGDCIDYLRRPGGGGNGGAGGCLRGLPAL